MEIKEAETLAVGLMIKYGLIGNGWRFKWDGAVRRVGATHFRSRDRSISMSVLAIKNAPELLVWETMLHEIAHALLDPKEAHSQGWVDTFRRLLDENGLQNVPVSRTAKIGNIVHHRYVGTCDHCGTKFGRHRATSRPVACSKCCDRANGGKFHEDFVVSFLDSKRGGAYVDSMTKTRKCQDCERRPIDTNTQGRDSTMCTECYDYAGWENTHSDNCHEDHFDALSDSTTIVLDDADRQLAEEISDCPVCQGLDPAKIPARKGTTNKNASGTQFSHAACDHESSKSARAKCRRDRSALTASGRCTSPSGEHKFQNDVCTRCAAPRP